MPENTRPPEPDVLDLGAVKVGDSKFFEVKVRNTYSDPKVVVPQFSCGACTHLEEMPDFIAGGAEGTFKFRFSPTATGAQVKSIFFNIDGRQETTFLFKADVTAE